MIWVASDTYLQSLRREPLSEHQGSLVFLEAFEGLYFQWDQLGLFRLALSGGTGLEGQRGWMSRRYVVRSPLHPQT